MRFRGRMPISGLSERRPMRCNADDCIRIYFVVHLSPFPRVRCESNTLLAVAALIAVALLVPGASAQRLSFGVVVGMGTVTLLRSMWRRLDSPQASWNRSLVAALWAPPSMSGYCRDFRSE